MNVDRPEEGAVLRDAFYELSLAKEAPDAQTLDELCRHYPEHCTQLTQFAISLAIDALTSDADTESESAARRVYLDHVSPMVSRAISHFHNRLHAAQHPSLAPAPSPAKYERVLNPFASLSRPACRAVASRLGANTVFIAKLRDRQIAPQTMTETFVQRVADELTVPTELLVRHFAAALELASGTFHKADGKPTDGGQQSFQDAVRSSGLSDAQQKHLLSL